MVAAERQDGSWVVLLDTDTLRACDGDVDAFAARLGEATAQDGAA
jgi:hypothetical protein